MKLTYIELLSPHPIIIPNVGTIIKPKLSTLDHRYNEYHIFLGTVLMTLESYCEKMGFTEEYKAMTVEEKTQINTFNMFVKDEEIRFLLQYALNFFFQENVLFDCKKNVFCLFKENDLDVENHEEHPSPVGEINGDNWSIVRDVIRQTNYISDKNEDISNAKGSKKALKILEKMLAGRKQKQELSAGDEAHEYDIGNMISVLASRSPNLNIINIWDITIYQLWDEYSRLKLNAVSDMDNRSISIWGGGNNKVNIYAWCKNIKHESDVSK